MYIYNQQYIRFLSNDARSDGNLRKTMKDLKIKIMNITTGPIIRVTYGISILENIFPKMPLASRNNQCIVLIQAL